VTPYSNNVLGSAVLSSTVRDLGVAWRFLRRP